MDLSTQYLGLELKNPIIMGSSGLTSSVEKIKNAEKSGAGAVVLKSIFEEEVALEFADFMKTAKNFATDSQYFDYDGRKRRTRTIVTSAKNPSPGRAAR